MSLNKLEFIHLRKAFEKDKRGCISVIKNPCFYKRLLSEGQTLFLMLVLVFQSDQSNEERSKQPTGRCSKDYALRYLCFKFLKNTCKEVRLLV